MQNNSINSPVFKSAQTADEVLRRYQYFLDSWPVPNSQLFVPTRQGKTFVLTCGPVTAPPVILLHGTMSNSASWLAEIALWTNSFRVYAIDVIGDAGFSAPARPPFNSDAYAQWLLDVMDALSVSRASFVGTSMGGGIALDFAIRQPDRVNSLVLQCPSGLANKNILWWALPLLLLGPWGANKVRERIIGKFPLPTSNQEKLFAEFTDAIFKGMRPRTEAPHDFTDKQLAHLSIPLLVLLGEHDVTMDSRLIKQRLDQLVQSAQTIILPGAAHYLGNQSPVIAAFLNRINSSRLSD